METEECMGLLFFWDGIGGGVFHRVLRVRCFQGVLIESRIEIIDELGYWVNWGSN